MWKFFTSLFCAVAALGATEAQRTDALFAAFTAPNTPGCAVGVMRDGETLYAKGHGLANLEQSVPLTPKSVFYLASVSKQFMAFAILQLEREGKLSTDDPIGRHVAGLPAHTAAVTIRQLLNHTGGVRDYLTLGATAGLSQDHVWTEHAMMLWLARQRALNFAPGSEHLYSNSGYVLLSLAAQKVAGAKLNDWMKQKVWTPLGMNQSRWQHDHNDPIALRASGYVSSQTQGWKVGNSMLDTVGDGGMYSSIEDMMRWAGNFDKPKLGGEFLDRMAQPGMINDGSVIANGYGMGLSRTKYRGFDAVAHGGSLAGYRTTLFRIPAKKFTVVCLCNNGNASAIRLSRQIADIWLEKEFESAAPPAVAAVTTKAPTLSAPSAAQIKAFTGNWFSPELEALYRIRFADGKLLLEIGDSAPRELLAGERGLLSPGNTGATLKIKQTGTGEGDTLVLDAGRIRGIEFRKRD